MYLTNNSILNLINEGNLSITPFDKASLDPTSYVLHLGNELYKVTPLHNKTFVDGSAPREKNMENIEVSEDGYMLQPKEFIIGKTLEVLTLPDNLAGIFDGKASLAQIGLFVHISSIHIEPLTNSKITLEIFNSSDFPVLLKVGMKIGQAIFLKIS